MGRRKFMSIEKIKKDLINEGVDPDDFNITILPNGYSLSPKWFYQIKNIAKDEDKPIKEDVDVTAETIVLTAQDVTMLADTVTQLATKIAELEGKISG